MVASAAGEVLVDETLPPWSDLHHHAAWAREPATTTVVDGSTENLTKVPDGGPARADLQSRTDEQWRLNARAVAAEIERQTGATPPPLVVLAGDPRARHDIRESLSPVLDMAVLAGIDTVVLDEERAAGRHVRPADHPYLPLPDGVRSADAVRSDVLVLAAAAATGAQAVFAAAPELPDDGVAALLRWHQATG